jgi:hypothetical protein
VFGTAMVMPTFYVNDPMTKWLGLASYRTSPYVFGTAIMRQTFDANDPLTK